MQGISLRERKMPKKSIKRKPVSKTAVKKSAKLVKKPVKKVTKKVAVKPVVKKAVKKAAVKKTVAKKVIKKIVAKPAVKKAVKKVAAKKPVAKKAIKKIAVKKIVSKSIPQEQKPIVITPIAGVKQINPHSRFTMFVYWGIILFFVCATFYILGRGHQILLKNNILGTSYTMSAQGSQLLESGKKKLLQGDVQGALVDVSAAIQSDPESAMAYTYRGEVYMSDANYGAAKTDFDKAIELKSRSSLAFYDRALLKIQMGELDEAMEDLNSALKIFGKNPNEVLTISNIYAKRAQLNLWMKNWDAAISDYDTAISETDKNQSEENIAGRGDAYTATGNYKAALRDYILAIKIISENIRNNADQADKINMSRRAMSYFEKSAALHIQLKNTEDARSDLESANALASALGDLDTQKRITELLIELNGKSVK